MAHRATFNAVAEPDGSKRNAFAEAHKIPPSRCFNHYKDLFESRIEDIDGVVIATQEDERIDPILSAMRHSCHILVEKPLTTNALDLMRLYEAVQEYPQILIVCHQLRLSPVRKMIKDRVDSGRYGDIVCIQHSENLSYSHMAHSYVRGFFNSSELSPMLLAKSCHDLDYLSYLVDGKATKVSSFGGLHYFKKENCPQGAPEYCLEGCKHYKQCPYHVLKLYFGDDADPAYIRQMGVVEDKEQLRRLLLKNRFGRCVFQSDNDVVDNQTVQIEFENGIHASFTMCGHNGVERRMTKISMTNGEIDLDGLSGDIIAYSFEPRFQESIKVEAAGTHGGGDKAIMDNFLDAIETDDRSILLTPIKNSLEGHLLVFAAEESRKTDRIIDLDRYEKALKERLEE